MLTENENIIVKKKVFTNLTKSIFYLQQAIRNEYPDDKELLQALDILGDKLNTEK